MRLNFNIEEVNRIATFIGTDGESGLMLVKDQGIYLMSTAKTDEGSATAANLVVYANGYNPSVDAFDDWWTGGDDFGEHISIKWVEEAIRHKAKEFCLNLNEKSISMVNFRPRRKNFKLTALLQEGIVKKWSVTAYNLEEAMDLVKSKHVALERIIDGRTGFTFYEAPVETVEPEETEMKNEMSVEDRAAVVADKSDPVLAKALAKVIVHDGEKMTIAELMKIHNILCDKDARLRSWKRPKMMLVTRIDDLLAVYEGVAGEPQEPVTEPEETPKADSKPEKKKATKKVKDNLGIRLVAALGKGPVTLATFAEKQGSSLASVRSYISYLRKGIRGCPQTDITMKKGVATLG